jgi:hypothetical protein
MRRNRWLPFSLAAVFLALSGLSACGGGGGTTGGGGGGGGTNPPTGLLIYPGANGAVSVPAGSTAQFFAYQADALASVNWTASSGTITGNGTSSGTFTAPTTQGNITISAVSTSSATIGGSVTVNVTAAATSGIVVSPGATMAQAGQVIAFSAMENGAPLAATWEVNGTPGGDGVHGTIDGSGNYTPPLTPPPTGSTSITAVDPGNTALSGSASVTVVYSTNSFQGPYAFSYSGNDVNGFVTVVGSFTADGISAASGEEDYVDTAGFSLGAVFAGSYTVGPDGRGALTINTGAGLDNGGVIEFALTNGQQGGAAGHAVLVRLDTMATGSGTLDAQNTLDLANGFSGNYVFGFSGLDFGGNPINMAGKFDSDGISTLLPGFAVQDFNYAGTNSSLDIDTTLTGGFVMDPDAFTTGRGTLTLSSTNTTFTTAIGVDPATLQYTFYIVDSKHLKVVETDGITFIAIGDIFAQAGGAGPYYAVNTLSAGNYAFTTGGTSNNGPFAAGGVFTSNGGAGGTATTGGITGGVYDNNNAGSAKLDLPFSTTESYSISTLGRITLPIEPNTTVYNYAGYAGFYNSPNGTVNVVEMLDLEENYVDSGLAYLQTGAGTPSGSYALNMSGVATSSQSEQDFEGQVAISTTDTVTGDVDINNAEVGNVDSNVPLTSSTITAVSTDGRGSPLTLHTTSPSTNYPLAYYVVDDFTTLVFETDSTRVLTGIIQKQY